MTTVHALATLAVCALLPAQGRVVSPARFAHAEGPGYSVGPWTRSASPSQRPMHCLEVHDLGAFQGQIYGLAYRLDNNVAQRSPQVPAFWVEAEVALSTAVTTSRTMSRTFSQNEGQDRRVVVARRRIHFGGFPRVGTLDQPFFYVVPFDAGRLFAFGGGSLAVDVRMYDTDHQSAVQQAGASFHFDSVTNSTVGLQRGLGSGCASGSQRPLESLVFTSITDTGQGLFLGYRGLTSQYPGAVAAVHVLGARRLPGSGVSLPGGCTLQIDPAASLMTIAGTPLSGSGRWAFPAYSGGSPGYLRTPWAPLLIGRTAYAQVALLDPAAVGGLVLSDATQVTLPGYDERGHGVAQISASGPAANDPRASFVYVDRGLVTQLLYR